MAWLNEEVAGLLREYAELTQITGGDVFRARNYEKAARSVRGWGDDIGPLDAKALRAQIPPGVLELTRVPGLGPKRALQLSRDLAVESVDDLAGAITAGRLDGLQSCAPSWPKGGTPRRGPALVTGE
jgi:DNA polymerase (family 10)